MDGSTDGGSVTALWLHQIRSGARDEELVVSEQERLWAEGLVPQRARLYLVSRSWIRRCLGMQHGVLPLQVPLQAPPGQSPQLAAGWGYLSLSHCPNACLLGWSRRPIGVDLERADRQLRSASLVRRFFTKEECKTLAPLVGDCLRRQVLDRWLIKEAAIKWQQGSIARDLRCWEVSPCLNAALHLGFDCQVAAQVRSQGIWRLGVVASKQQFLHDCSLYLT